MRCAMEMLADKKVLIERKREEFQKILLTETYDFCETILSPYLEKYIVSTKDNSLSHISFDNYKFRRFIKFDKEYFMYSNLHIDFDLLKSYLNTFCFDVKKLPLGDVNHLFWFSVNPQCLAN